ncbi:MAG: zinc-ribbon domain-containing protein [Oscillospiraceae bacterium]|jgi:uncharacterized membrane protein|nr:zinc-ribbon domain-containing protein [Oscillospiraceae bacterium]
MAFCGNCGTQVQDGVKFCPSCGKEVAASPARQGYTPPGGSDQGVSQDAQENKGMAIISYILFFVPLLTGAHKTSPFVKYHANQGTALFLVAAAYSVASGILRAVIRVPVTIWGLVVYTTPTWLSTILWLISIPILILCVLGIINAVNGRTKPLPVIGGITILK